MIAIDWGSSSQRAFHLGADGSVIDQRRDTQGLLACQGRFEAVLRELIADWDDELILLAGMIGSRQGWVEVPYLECPATLRDIAARMTRITPASLPDRQVWIVPGLLYRSSPDVADVLRGEEAQLCGLMRCIDAQPQIACMPGTHSKWAMIANGCVESFFTAMTGEVFDVLRHHSLLGRLMSEGLGPLDPRAFHAGMSRARQPGGLLHHLFTVRTAGLLETFGPAQLSSYLSGLLIAHELLDSGWCEQARGCPVHLIGAPALVHAYSLALDEFHVTVQRHGETLAAAGLLALARAAGLDDRTSRETSKPCS